MKTLELIAMEKFGTIRWALMGKEQCKEIISAMREACEQAIDECSDDFKLDRSYPDGDYEATYNIPYQESSGAKLTFNKQSILNVKNNLR